MIRGYYSAAAGVFGQQKSFNTISNNIANASTVGFKVQGTVESSFGDHMVSRMNGNMNVADKDIGAGSFMTINSSVYTDFTQGALQPTGRSVDMAVEGEGFFLIKTPAGEEVLTRNGQFEIDQDGHLSLAGVGKVLNESKGNIELKTMEFSVDSAGNIKEGETAVGTLFIGARGNEEKLTSVGNGTYKSEEAYAKEKLENYSVSQGALEKSNINISQEMTKIISGQNRYQSCTQILKIYDRINEIAANQIGRIG